MIGRLGLALLVVGLVLAGCSAVDVAAAPAVQAQASPIPRPTLKPTMTDDEKLASLQRDKLDREIALLDSQQNRLKQEQVTDSQAWRAPTAFIAAVGPTLVGLAVVYQLSRALRRWRPGDAPRPGPLEETVDDEAEL